MLKTLRRINPVMLVGLAVTVVCLILFLWGPGFIQAISNYAYDALLRRVSEPPKSGRVVIVDIDDDSMADPHLGQWPWPRYLVARLNDRIFESGASVLAYDILFSEQDRTSPKILTARIKRAFDADVHIKGLPDEVHDFDQVFAGSLSNRNAILGIMMWPVDRPADMVDDSIDPFYSSYLSFMGKAKLNPIQFLVQADTMSVPILALNEAANTAFFNALVDSDSVVRSNPLIWAYGPKRVYPALALEAVRLDKGISSGMVFYDENGITRIRLGSYMIPTDHAGRIVVNYRTINKSAKSGFYSSFPTYSAKDILDGKVGSRELADKIVFMGTSAAALKDLRATPLTQHFSGVEIHATMVDNILADDMLLAPSYLTGVQAIFILLTGLALSFLIARGRSWMSFLVTVAMIWIAYASSVLLIQEYHLVFVPVWIIITIVIVYLVLTMIKFWQEELQKKKVRDMFGTMVSEDVLTYLEKNPGSFSLSGQKAEATMFFSDVRAFTTISESLEPAKLSELLNRYLSPMTQIIMDRGGYVDKYQGDAIMAEWGVPFPTEDHAVQACLAAIEQQAALDRIRPALLEEFGHELHVRMGINSGTVTAGNMGSDRRFQYTVMGDPVNQAARFEPANKDYGTMIAIGETTYEAAKDHIEARMLDKIIVKGKTRPILLYELIARKGEIDEQRRKVTDLYEEALKAHWDRDWDRAERLLKQALSLDQEDGPCVKLLLRISGYREAEPEVGWNGEFIRATKD